MNGSSVQIATLGNEDSEDFFFGEVCSYELIWPDNEYLNERDSLVLQATQIPDSVHIYVAYGLEDLTKTFTT